VSAGLNDTPPLRIVMTADAVGGVWQYALDLAGDLIPHGVEVTLAILGPNPTPDQQALAENVGARLIATGLPLEWMAQTPEEVRATGQIIARLAADSGADIVHLNNPALAADTAFPAPVLAVCHSCVATWWQAVREGPMPEDFVWRTELVRRAYEAADLLAAPTAAFAEATARFYGLASPPIVIPNGRRAPQVEETLREIFAFTAGRLWDEGKNVAVLDRAAARLSIPLLAAGPCQGPNGIRINVSYVNALGKKTDREIAQYLSAKPIFVSAARYEPFGLAVLEAAQAGCALVLSDIPTFRELWDGAAIFVSPDDDEEIATILDELNRDADGRARLGKAAQERAGTYTPQAMGAKVLTAYRSLLASRRDHSSVENAAA
jgi:glycosyltransferase involved in cell wall biosynthesis